MKTQVKFANSDLEDLVEELAEELMEEALDPEWAPNWPKEKWQNMRNYDKMRWEFESQARLIIETWLHSIAAGQLPDISSKNLQRQWLREQAKVKYASAYE